MAHSWKLPLTCLKIQTLDLPSVQMSQLRRQIPRQNQHKQTSIPKPGMGHRAPKMKITTWICLRIGHPQNPMVSQHFPIIVKIASPGIFPPFSNPEISGFFQSPTSSTPRPARSSKALGGWAPSCLHWHGGRRPSGYERRPKRPPAAAASPLGGRHIDRTPTGDHPRCHGSWSSDAPTSRGENLSFRK